MIDVNANIDKNYRKDIDGLRAVAVLCVISYHIAPSWVKGGFLGVDIFFVISGYLITKIISSELVNNSFSILRFYQRRILRIFPALITVMLACLILGWFLSPTGHYERLGKHVIASATFVSNLLLWSEAGYFDAVSTSKPLLHLWSLGVEEQFYIFWPVILFVIWKFGLNSISFLLIFLLFSLLSAFAIAKIDAVAFFYSPLTRAWELLMGGLLAVSFVFKAPLVAKLSKIINHWLKMLFLREVSKDANILNNLTSVLGIALIGVGFYKIGNGAAFRTDIAFITVTGTCLIILAGPAAIFNKYILSNRIAVSIGLISYPLYLWHWPLFSFANYINLSQSFELPLVFLTFLLSWMTYRFIEKPIRYRQNKKLSTQILVGGMVTSAAFGFIVFHENGLPKRYQNHHGQYNLHGSFMEHQYIDYVWCDGAPEVNDSWCRTMKDPTTILIGDSHIDQLLPRFAENGYEPFASLVSLGAGNCAPLLRRDQSEHRCTKQISHSLSELKSYPTLEYAIISSWNTQYGEPNKAFEAFIPVIEELHAEGIKVAMIVDNPTLKKPPRHCSLSWPRLKLMISGPPEYCENPSASDFEPYSNYAAFIDKVKLKYPEIFIFNPLPIFCKDSVCNIRTGPIMNYVDEGHISSFMGKKVVDSFVEAAKARGF